MLAKSKDERDHEDSAAFNRQFKYAVIAYAIIEFIAIAFVVSITKSLDEISWPTNGGLHVRESQS